MVAQLLQYLLAIYPNGIIYTALSTHTEFAPKINVCAAAANEKKTAQCEQAKIVFIIYLFFLLLTLVQFNSAGYLGLDTYSQTH